ncbi:mRNA export factor GLE1 isoform X2 [Silene latifolia]|uniref:mRNA export factor GLE1 isoform X2 n=1 Tax=Silene latifolia TaxID=37657 RepID=UPI003D78100F
MCKFKNCKTSIGNHKIKKSPFTAPLAWFPFSSFFSKSKILQFLNQSINQSLDARLGLCSDTTSNLGAEMIILEPKCPKSVNGLSLDPNPNWSFTQLVSDLNSLESKLTRSNSPLPPTPFTKSPTREIRGVAKREANQNNAFRMQVIDFEFDDSDEEKQSRDLVPAVRFGCNDIYASESEGSDDEAMNPLQVHPINKMGVTETAFLEMTHQHKLGFTEEIRNQVTSLEAQLVAEKEKYASAIVREEKVIEARREMDRKLDMHYQRKIAEALDNHLTAIQRDHEHRAQIEERRIRDDATVEEAKRKEKTLLEEKLRQLKAKEEEARREAAKRAEERKAAEEAERAKEAAEKLANEKSAAATGTPQNVVSTSSTANVPGNLLRAAENALKLEERRLQSYKELEDTNHLLLSGANTDLQKKEREIARRIKQISGSVENVQSKTSEFLKIFNDPALPQSVTIAIFAKKVISIYETPNSNFNSSAFACGHVVVYVSAQVPAVMNSLLTEFHKACMYTVPKHITYSEAAFQTKQRYFKAIGFREEDGNLETMDQYLERLRSYMKLYGALVQTEAQGVQNVHGLEEGWTWLARFLNALPANLFTAVALEAFLRMAGFALHKKYKDQFRKILTAISREFVHKLKASANPRINSVVTRLEEYIDSNRFLEEPEGWCLKTTLLSRNADFESRDDGRQQYHQQSSYGQHHQYQQYGHNSFNQYY